MARLKIKPEIALQIREDVWERAVKRMESDFGYSITKVNEIQYDVTPINTEDDATLFKYRLDKMYNQEANPGCQGSASIILIIITIICLL
jgi:hypothetical protein